MKRFSVLASIFVFLGLACNVSSLIGTEYVTPTATAVTETATPTPEPATNPQSFDSAQSLRRACRGDKPPISSGQSPPQIGLNFIRFYWGEGNTVDATTPYAQPEWIFNDFGELGIDAFRQFIKADLFWGIVEPQDDQWHFAEADSVIMTAEFEPIVTLFSLQYASPTPPWPGASEFQKTMGPEAIEYVTTVVQRYAPYVTYWEIGNEMDHWRAYDPNQDSDLVPQRPPAVTPDDGFSPQEQGAFLAEVAAIICANDPDAVILMPGMGGLDDYTLDTWLLGVIEGGGSDWFDIVNYHFYASWEQLVFHRRHFRTFLEEHGLADKPVWLTETGVTADPTLTGRTDYPNSPETQAAAIFRRAIPAYALGDSFVGWHTYIGSPATPNNLWRLYGVRTDTAEAQPSYYALQLFTSELLPYASVAALSGEPGGVSSYKITTQSGAVKYVAWGSGAFTVPDGVTRMTAVVANAGGSYTWQNVTAGERVALSEIPVLLK